jgi:hypothetical protein
MERLVDQGWELYTTTTWITTRKEKSSKVVLLDLVSRILSEKLLHSVYFWMIYTFNVDWSCAKTTNSLNWNQSSKLVYTIVWRGCPQGNVEYGHWLFGTHQRVATIRIQKAMKRIIKWAEDTGFKVSTEKTKAIMFSRRKCSITTRPRMNIWEKGEKIEQVRPHRILRLTGWSTLRIQR